MRRKSRVVVGTVRVWSLSTLTFLWLERWDECIPCFPDNCGRFSVTGSDLSNGMRRTRHTYNIYSNIKCIHIRAYVCVYVCKHMCVCTYVRTYIRIYIYTHTHRTTHSTHFIYGYMASDIWLRTILIVRKETRCRHIGYSYRLTARVLLYAPSHRQDNTYHGLYYTSRGALAGTKNSSMGPPHEGSIRRPIAT